MSGFLSAGRIGPAFRRASLARLARATALALGAVMFAPVHAAAQNPVDPFSALLKKSDGTMRRAGAPGKVERYQTVGGTRAFLYENLGRTARMRFLCGRDDPRMDCLIDDETPAEEIYVLTAMRGPRGDTIYKDESGRAFLRMTPYGGTTVFWPNGDVARGDAPARREPGRAATRTFSEDPSLALYPADRAVAAARARRATAILSARTGAPIIFELPPLAAQSAPTRLAANDAFEETRRELAAAETARAFSPRDSLSSFTAPSAAPPSVSAPVRTSFVAGLDVASPGEEARARDGRPGSERAPATAADEFRTDDSASDDPISAHVAQGADAVLADAIARAAAGLAYAARDAAGARVLGARLRTVSFRPSAAPDVRLEGRALVVSYVPDRGMDGRLSSARIAAFVEDNL